MDKNYPVITNKGVSITPGLDVKPSGDEPMPQRWMIEQKTARKSLPSINANQMTSISAMVAYIAHRSGQSEFRIERSLSDHFSVANTKFLAARDFDNAIRYLADILHV